MVDNTEPGEDKTPAVTKDDIHDIVSEVVRENLTEQTVELKRHAFWTRVLLGLAFRVGLPLLAIGAAYLGGAWFGLG